MTTYIQAVGAYVPQKKLSNDDLAKIVDTSDEWIYSHTGIKFRHIAAPEEATSDLAVAAVKSLLEKNGLTTDMIGGIVLSTATGDYHGFPSTACVIQDKLGLDVIPAFDIAAGCTGFIYAVEVASALMKANSYEHMVVIGAEKLSDVTDWTDRNTCVLFGDGAGAVLLSQDPEDKRGVIDSVLHAKGSGNQYLSVPSGGTADKNGENTCLYMDGRAVYNFAVKAMKDTIEELLERNSLTIDDIDYVIPHQANFRIINACAKRIGTDPAKFFLNIDQYANTSAASIPIAMNEMVDKGLLKEGMKIITVGFGAGLTYGGNYLVW